MLDGTLRRFLAKTAFDLAIVSAPHPECFFDWLHNRSLPWCVDHYGLKLPPKHNVSLRVLGDIMDKSLGRRWVFVDPWTQRSPLPHYPFSAPRVVSTRSIALPYKCSVPDCTAHLEPLDMHLCQPGMLPFVSRHIMKSTRRLSNAFGA